MATETFSQDFKRIFLLTFTKELIIHSAKREMTKLQSIIESKEQKRKEKNLREPGLTFTRELGELKEIKSFQKITPRIQRTYEMSSDSSMSDIPVMPSIYPERKIVTREIDQEFPSEFPPEVQTREETEPPIKPQLRLPESLPSALPAKLLIGQPSAKPKIRQITKPSAGLLPARQGIRYPLFIPEPKLPSHLEYLQPIPTPGIEIDLFKLNPLINDPAVRIIEVNPDEKVVVSGTMGTMPTDTILNKEDIDRVISKFSEVSKIPVTEGIYKIVVGNLVLSAIVSETVTSKFIIKKMFAPKLPSENQQQSQQPKPNMLPFQDENLE